MNKTAQTKAEGGAAPALRARRVGGAAHDVHHLHVSYSLRFQYLGLSYPTIELGVFLGRMPRARLDYFLEQSILSLKEDRSLAAADRKDSVLAITASLKARRKLLNPKSKKKMTRCTSLPRGSHLALTTTFKGSTAQPPSRLKACDFS